MKAIIPTQQIIQTGEKFPVEGDTANMLCCLVSMELYGCSKAEIARQINGTIDDVDALIAMDEYADVKMAIIDNIRRVDQNTLAGKIIQEANNAFERTVELSETAEREDVRFWANKDIMDRAMMTSAAQQADELTITFKKKKG